MSLVQIGMLVLIMRHASIMNSDQAKPLSVGE